MQPNKTGSMRYPTMVAWSATVNLHPIMAHIILAVYLILIGLNILFGLNLPSWVFGVCALAAGILLLAERFGITAKRK